MSEKLAYPQFSKGLSGYKTEEVDSYIEKMMDTIKELQEQNEVLEDKIGVLAESLQKYRDDEDSLREALLGAQKMGDSIVKNANNKAEITMREASVKAAHIVEEARKKVEDEKDELIRVQNAAADFKARLIELYREHIELVTRIPVTDSAPVEEPAEKNEEEATIEEVQAEQTAAAEEPAKETPAEVTEAPAAAAEEAAAVHEQPTAEEVTVAAEQSMDDIPEAGKDIFAEFEKKKQQILNFDMGEQKDTERRSKFEGLKFGNDFNLMDDEDDDF